jgi:hypothetical protein
MVAKQRERSKDAAETGRSLRAAGDGPIARATKATRTSRRQGRVKAMKPSGSNASEHPEDGIELPPMSSWYGG